MKPGTTHEDPCNGRTWTDPGWGQSAFLIPPYTKDTVVKAGGRRRYLEFAASFFLIFIFFNSIWDKNTLDAKIKFYQLIHQYKFLFIICLSFTISLIISLISWKNRKKKYNPIIDWVWDTDTTPGPQAEFFANGILPHGHRFVKGLHPFYWWHDIICTDYRFDSETIWLTIQHISAGLPLELVLGHLQSVALEKALMNLEKAKSTSLNDSLRMINQQRAQGIKEGRGTV
jgi:hypothetical protein